MSVIDREALFCDETKDYRNPYEPDAGDTVCLRLRTARDNADSDFLYRTGDENPKENEAGLHRGPLRLLRNLRGDRRGAGFLPF